MDWNLRNIPGCVERTLWCRSGNILVYLSKISWNCTDLALFLYAKRKIRGCSSRPDAPYNIDKTDLTGRVRGRCARREGGGR